MNENTQEVVKNMRSNLAALAAEHMSAESDEEAHIVMLKAVPIYLALFEVFMKEGNTEEGIWNYKEAVRVLAELFNETGDKKYFYGFCEKSLFLARWHSDNDYYEEAETYFTNLLSLTDTHIDVHPLKITIDDFNNPAILELKGKITFFYAILLRRMKEYKKCLRIYDISFEFFKILQEKGLDFKSQLLQMQSNIAHVYDEMGDFDMANTYFNLAIGALIAWESRAKGVYTKHILGYANEMFKLYDKYSKPDKKDLLSKAIENDFSEETKWMLDELGIVV